MGNFGVASFTVMLLQVIIPFTVQFNDTSTTTPTGWAWFFGDWNFKQVWTRQNASSGWIGRDYHSLVAMPDGSIVLTGG